MEALPTLVSFPKSNNYRDGRPGVIYIANLQLETELNADERERLL